MAALSLRLRRCLTSLSTLHRFLSTQSTNPFPLPQPIPTRFPIFPSQTPIRTSFFQTRNFSQGTTPTKKQYKLYKEGDEITEDTILFEGCDFEHWLITVDFPKDPKPSPEEMVATYERICAQGLNISIEEAKKKIYACSTTTYQGFQALMSEEESERFKDVPGVVFVLPDSYIDPINKEYGGDKYENGVITHRPPPYMASHARRNSRQPRYEQRGAPIPNEQRGSQYGSERSMQRDNRNFGPPANYPPQQEIHGRSGHWPPQNYPSQQNYGPPGQRQQMPMNNRNVAPGGWDSHQANRGPMPSYQDNYSQKQHGNYPSQDQKDFPQGDQRNYGGWDTQQANRGPVHSYQDNYNQKQQGNYPPQDQREFPQGDQRNQVGWDSHQANRGPLHSYQDNYNQKQLGNYPPQDQRDIPQGDQRNYGSFQQPSFVGNNRNYSTHHVGSNWEDAKSGHGQLYHSDDQRFSQMEQQNMHVEQRSVWQ